MFLIFRSRSTRGANLHSPRSRILSATPNGYFSQIRMQTVRLRADLIPRCLRLQVNGQWKGLSAGGCGNYKDSYKHNPIYQLNLERPGPLLIQLRGSRSEVTQILRITETWWDNPVWLPVSCRQYSVGFEMVTVSTVGDPGSSTFQKKNSGDYRCGGWIPQISGPADRSSSYLQEKFVDSASSSLRSQMWLLLLGGGARPSWPLQRHPHHLPAQAGGTLLPGLFQHVSSQGVAAPVKLGRGLWDASEAGLRICSSVCECGGRRRSVWNQSCPRRSSTTGREFCKQELRWRDGSPEPLELGQDQRVRTRSCFNLSFSFSNASIVGNQITIQTLVIFCKMTQAGTVSFSGAQKGVSGWMMSLPVASFT